MNFAEFPIALLSERAPAGVTTLEFELNDWDSSRKQRVTRKLTVEGSQKHGLLTAKDDEVLLGLIQLTKATNNFSSPVVPFTQRALLMLLKWSDEGRSYNRLRKALHRLQGVSLYYENAWKDNANKKYVTQGGFGVLARFEIRDARANSKSKDEPESMFEWSSVIHQSFQANHLKRLDYELVQSFRFAATKRLFRYLDKHFYPEVGKTTLQYDLEQLAYQHLGVRKRRDPSAVKDAIRPAIEELEEAGIIQRLSPNKRFQKQGPRTWRVTFSLNRNPKRPAELASGPDQKSSAKAESERILVRQFWKMDDRKRTRLLKGALKHADQTNPKIADGYRRSEASGGEASIAYLEMLLSCFAKHQKKNSEFPE